MVGVRCDTETSTVIVPAAADHEVDVVISGTGSPGPGVGQTQPASEKRRSRKRENRSGVVFVGVIIIFFHMIISELVKGIAYFAFTVTLGRNGILNPLQRAMTE